LGIINKALEGVCGGIQPWFEAYQAARLDILVEKKKHIYQAARPQPLRRLRAPGLVGKDLRVAVAEGRSPGGTVLNSRDRVLSAMNLEEPDTVPLTELGVFPHIVSAVAGGLGEEAYLRCFEKLGLDMITVGEAPPGAEHLYGARGGIVVDEWGLIRTSKQSGTEGVEAGGTRVDEWGVRWRDVGGIGWYVDGSLKNPDDVKSFEPPDPYKPGRMRYVESMVKMVDARMAVMGSLPGEKNPYLMRGLEAFTADLYLRPGVARRLVDMVTRYNVGLCRQMAELGVDGVVVGGDLAERHGPLFKPQLYAEFFAPCLRAIVEEGHRRGILVVKHSDGNLYPILEDMVATGIDGLHSIEPMAGMEIGRVKQAFGERICLLGNIDCSHTLCTKEQQEVEREVMDCIRAASHGGGHIISSSNAFHAAVRLPNVLAMIGAARKYGRYLLRKG